MRFGVSIPNTNNFVLEGKLYASFILLLHSPKSIKVRFGFAFTSLSISSSELYAFIVIPEEDVIGSTFSIFFIISSISSKQIPLNTFIFGLISTHFVKSSLF